MPKFICPISIPFDPTSSDLLLPFRFSRSSNPDSVPLPNSRSFRFINYRFGSCFYIPGAPNTFMKFLQQLFLRLEGCVLAEGVPQSRFPRLLAELVRCLVLDGEVDVKAEQRVHEHHRDQNQQKQDEIYDQFGHFHGLLLRVKNFNDGRYDLNDVNQEENGKANQVQEEVLVIFLPNAVSYPRAVMIEPLNAHIAVVAVRGTRGSKDVAGVAELDLEGVRFDGAGVEDGFHIADSSVDVVGGNGYFFEVFMLVLAVDFGDDARIRKRQNDHEGQAQKMKNDGENEKGEMFLG